MIRENSDDLGTHFSTFVYNNVKFVHIHESREELWCFYVIAPRKLVF